MTAAAGAAPTRFSFRDAGIIARFELGEALRTRLLVVMVLLFMGGGGLAAWGFSRFLSKLETTAAAAMGAPSTQKPGAAMERLRKTPVYRQLLQSAVSEPERAEYYASLPPMVVFYAWMTLMFTPWLVLFTSSDTIATEVASRAVRYTTLRTGALEYAVGKLCGQAILLAGVIGLCGLTFFVVSWICLAEFHGGEIALGILSFWPRVFVHTLPFLGIAMLASMLTASGNLARVTALGGAVVLSILSGMAESSWFRTGPISNAAWDLVQLLTPFEHADGLMWPRGSQLLTDVLICLSLTVLYFGLGYLRLRRRDL